MNESFTHQEIIDCTPEQVVTMVTQVCTELKSRIHRNLKQSNFGFIHIRSVSYYRYMDLEHYKH